MRLITKLAGAALIGGVSALAGCSYDDHDHYGRGPRRAYLYEEAHVAGYHEHRDHRHRHHRHYRRDYHDDHRHHHHHHRAHRDWDRRGDHRHHRH